jgi:UDP-N-acetylmuramyl pentapeptide phosphotransferase/UDP-N-acetylglucosamine-1-phosphate transferase
VIGIVFISYIVGLMITSPYTPGVLRSSHYLYVWSGVLICCLLGLAEDIKADFLSPRLRLGSKFVVFGALFYLVPGLVPQSLGVPGLDRLLQIDLIAWALTVIFCVGFINAFNMSDGANGLIPGIATFTVAIFFLTYARPAEGALLFTCSIFLLFNVFTGRFFLGDMGSYGLGAIVVIYGLEGVIQGDFSAAMMAALLAYPCIDFLVSIGRRLARGYSPFAADNGHLHNLIHRWLKTHLSSGLLANSLTGLLITCSSAGLVFVGFMMQWWPITSSEWGWIFVFELLLYCYAMVMLRRAGFVTVYKNPE